MAGSWRKSCVLVRCDMSVVSGAARHGNSYPPGWQDPGEQISDKFGASQVSQQACEWCGSSSLTSRRRLRAPRLAPVAGVRRARRSREPRRGGRRTGTQVCRSASRVPRSARPAHRSDCRRACPHRPILIVRLFALLRGLPRPEPPGQPARDASRRCRGRRTRNQSRPAGAVKDVRRRQSKRASTNCSLEAARTVA